jgi:hypothetical protein
MQYLYIHEYFYHLQRDHLSHLRNISLQSYRFLDIFSIFHGWVPVLEPSKEKVCHIFIHTEFFRSHSMDGSYGQYMYL